MKLSVSINLFFFFAFTLHMLFIIYNQIYPDNPSLRMYKRPLEDIIFPITLKFCIRELENASARYQKYGYCNFWPFYLGQRCYGGNIFGWNGHTRNGSTIATVKGTRYFRNSCFIIICITLKKICLMTFHLTGKVS